MVWQRSFRWHATLINIKAYQRTTTVADTCEIDDVPIDADLYHVHYTCHNQRYLACSSVLTWPISYAYSLQGLMRRPRIVRASLITDSVQLDVTSIFRTLAGVQGDFHVHHNTLTWQQLLSSVGTSALPTNTMVSITFFRFTISQPYRYMTSTMHCSVGDDVARARPYVL